MTSYERVRKALTFEKPDRIPLAMGPDSDIAGIGYKPDSNFEPRREGMNEWGIVWRSLNPEQGDQGQVLVHPLADWDCHKTYSFPDPFAPGRFDHVASALDAYRQAGRYVVGHMGKGPMHLLDDLRGFQNYLADLMIEPERIEWMLDGIFSVLDGLMRQFADASVDAIHLTDDQAMQSGPIFSMDLWRQYLKPRYRKMFEWAHAHGLLVFMHACGNLSEHLVDLHEAGVDVIDNKQPALWMHCPAVDEVRGRMSFSTCLDIQSVMQTIPLNQIHEETARLIRRLSLPDGGFVGTYYPKPDLNISPEKNTLMVELFKTFSWD